MSSTHSTSENHTHGGTASRLLHSVRRSITPSSKRHHRSQSYFNPRTQSMHMYSTPEESSLPVRASSFREPSYTNARPSIEQIAMGLHISRTPHILPSSPRSQQHSYPQSHYSAPSSTTTLPPLRARSSLKKPKFRSLSSTTSGSDTLSPGAAILLSSPASASGSASASSSTVTSSSLYLITSTAASAGAPVPRGAAHGGNALSSLKLRMAKLLPGEKKRSASWPAVNGLMEQQKETLDGSHLQRRSTTATTRKAVRFAQNDVQQKPRR